jgi:hypothetical protein
MKFAPTEKEKKSKLESREEKVDATQKLDHKADKKDGKDNKALDIAREAGQVKDADKDNKKK